MKTKIILFDLELAKKIQAGEIEGKIKTRDGNKARILCTDLQDDTYPIVAAIKKEYSSKEDTHLYTFDGFYHSSKNEFPLNLVLEVPDDEPQFKPFDRVLVRDYYDDTWRCSLFSHKNDDGYCAAGLYWKQCIPYAGNEHLVGTTNKPKEE